LCAGVFPHFCAETGAGAGVWAAAACAVPAPAGDAGQREGGELHSNRCGKGKPQVGAADREIPDVPQLKALWMAPRRSVAGPFGRAGSECGQFTVRVSATGRGSLGVQGIVTLPRTDRFALTVTLPPWNWSVPAAVGVQSLARSP
jgi:hypothetical protein